MLSALETRSGTAAGVSQPGDLLREFLIWDRALADLEQAAAWAHGDLRLQTGIMLTYAKCLQERPEHVRRWLAIASPANVSPGVGYADSNLGVDRCFSVMTAINRPGDVPAT